MLLKCAVSTLGVMIVFFFLVTLTSSRIGTKLEQITDDQMTAWESGEAPIPLWMKASTNIPDTQKYPKPPVSRKRPWTKAELELEAWNAARTWNVHPIIYLRLVKRESHWRIRARSPLKVDPARGLVQMRCLTTARGLGYIGRCYDLQRHPLVSLFYGAKYLRQLVDRYGNYRSAVAAFYAGPKRWNMLVQGKLKKDDAAALWAKISNYLDEVIPKTNVVPKQFVNLGIGKHPNRCHERIANAACIWRFGENYERFAQRTQLILN